MPPRWITVTIVALLALGILLTVALRVALD
jgi:hypothetical protein